VVTVFERADRIGAYCALYAVSPTSRWRSTVIDRRIEQMQAEG